MTAYVNGSWAVNLISPQHARKRSFAMADGAADVLHSVHTGCPAQTVSMVGLGHTSAGRCMPPLIDPPTYPPLPPGAVERRVTATAPSLRTVDGSASTQA